jgi:hypothetical protein
MPLTYIEDGGIYTYEFAGGRKDGLKGRAALEKYFDVERLKREVKVLFATCLLSETGSYGSAYALFSYEHHFFYMSESFDDSEIIEDYAIYNAEEGHYAEIIEIDEYMDFDFHLSIQDLDLEEECIVEDLLYMIRIALVLYNELYETRNGVANVIYI